MAALPSPRCRLLRVTTVRRPPQWFRRSRAHVHVHGPRPTRPSPCAGGGRRRSPPPRTEVARSAQCGCCASSPPPFGHVGTQEVRMREHQQAVGSSSTARRTARIGSLTVLVLALTL